MKIGQEQKGERKKLGIEGVSFCMMTVGAMDRPLIDPDFVYRFKTDREGGEGRLSCHRGYPARDYPPPPKKKKTEQTTTPDNTRVYSLKGDRARSQAIPDYNQTVFRAQRPLSS